MCLTAIFSVLPITFPHLLNWGLVPPQHDGVKVAAIGPLQLERGEDFRGLSPEPAKGQIDTAPQDRLR